mmetsp:Transcript_55464/g.164896  ORF Transcript_55464/g.164896 Transcript_55464/m.164896 type:complete len:327 (+) Transcript_55464:272-1252(+)
MRWVPAHGMLGEEAPHEAGDVEEVCLGAVEARRARRGMLCAFDRVQGHVRSVSAAGERLPAHPGDIWKSDCLLVFATVERPPPGELLRHGGRPPVLRAPALVRVYGVGSPMEGDERHRPRRVVGLRIPQAADNPQCRDDVRELRGQARAEAGAPGHAGAEDAPPVHAEPAADVPQDGPHVGDVVRPVRRVQRVQLHVELVVRADELGEDEGNPLGEAQEVGELEEFVRVVPVPRGKQQERQGLARRCVPRHVDREAAGAPGAAPRLHPQELVEARRIWAAGTAAGIHLSRAGVAQRGPDEAAQQRAPHHAPSGLPAGRPQQQPHER